MKCTSAELCEERASGDKMNVVFNEMKVTKKNNERKGLRMVN